MASEVKIVLVSIIISVFNETMIVWHCYCIMFVTSGYFVFGIVAPTSEVFRCKICSRVGHRANMEDHVRAKHVCNYRYVIMWPPNSY